MTEEKKVAIGLMALRQVLQQQAREKNVLQFASEVEQAFNAGMADGYYLAIRSIVLDAGFKPPKASEWNFASRTLSP